ncbi:MAG: PaaI family thioesterase [Solirubrobacteraceae bacterium]
MTDPHFRTVPGVYAPVVAPERSFDALLGLELVEHDTPGVLRARVAVRDELRARAGGLHGGVITAVAESLASRGTWIGVGDPGKLVMGLSNETSHLSPIRSGHLNALASVRDRGEAAWLWEVQSLDDADRLCALTIVTIAVRAPRA